MRHGTSGPVATLILLGGVAAGPLAAGEASAQAEATLSVTQDLAKTVTDNLSKCEVKVTNHRTSAVGTITASDGTTLTVPAETLYQKGAKLPDLFNECNNATPQKLT